MGAQILKTSRLENMDFFEKVYGYVFRALSGDVCLKAFDWSPDDISFYVYRDNPSSFSQSIVLLKERQERQDGSVEPICSMLIVKIGLETLHSLKYRNTRRILRLTRRRQRRRLLKAAIGKAVYGAAIAHGSFKVCLGDTVLVDVSSIEEFLIGIDLACVV